MAILRRMRNGVFSVHLALVILLYSAVKTNAIKDERSRRDVTNSSGERYATRPTSETRTAPSTLPELQQFIATLSLEDLSNPQTVLTIIKGSQMVVDRYVSQGERLGEALAIIKQLTVSPDHTDFRDIIEQTLAPSKVANLFRCYRSGEDSDVLQLQILYKACLEQSAEHVGLLLRAFYGLRLIDWSRLQVRDVRNIYRIFNAMDAGDLSAVYRRIVERISRHPLVNYANKTYDMVEENLVAAFKLLKQISSNVVERDAVRVFRQLDKRTDVLRDPDNPIEYTKAVQELIRIYFNQLLKQGKLKSAISLMQWLANVIGDSFFHGLIKQVVQILYEILSDYSVQARKMVAMAQKQVNMSAQVVGILETIGSTKVIKSNMDVTQTALVSQTVLDINEDNFSMVYFDVSPGKLTRAVHNVTMAEERRAQEDMEDDPQAISVELPASVLRAARCESESEDNSSSCGHRLQFNVYATDILFQEVHHDKFSETMETTSFVLGIKMNNLQTLQLPEPIRLTFLPLRNETDTLKHICMFWNYRLYRGMGGWSTIGCKRLPNPTGLVTCQCSHMTNFALLLAETPSTSQELIIASKVGLILSIGGLVATIIALLFLRFYVKETPSMVILGLSTQLLALQLTFLLGVRKTEDKPTCKAVGVLLHYFILSTFFWSAVKAFLLHRKVIKVFNSEISHFFLKAIAFCQGIPGLIVAFTTCLAWNDYQTKTFCHLQSSAVFYIFLVTPMVIILVLNAFLFIRMLTVLLKKKSAIALKKKRHAEKGKLRRVLMSVNITMLLSLTWLLGLMLLGNGEQSLQWVFAVFVTTQGIFIFVLEVIVKRKTRAVFGRVTALQRKRALRKITLSASTFGSRTTLTSISWKGSTSNDIHASTTQIDKDSPKPSNL